ncbi:MAG: nitroreductase/quinone reductase family protein [Chloroflexota bacterium]|nr:nitroreductase/quinone reductase family protein [Chloroflexota bacterium]MDE2638821.1 nitroreductase/quinone reductase family protein [Chloroflexota bacterium]MYE25715.1 nitroreductase family deazaflavin-dependent oxidoreductase [Chloroflexota bacterium]
MANEKYLYLTTIGHRSGKRHEIEIWYVEHEGCYYIVSEKREGAHWVQNIRANPAIRFRLGTEMNDSATVTHGLASIPEDAALIAAVKAKMDAKYGWSNGLVVGIAAV